MNQPTLSKAVLDRHMQKKNACCGSCHDPQHEQTPAPAVDACCAPVVQSGKDMVQEKGKCCGSGHGQVSDTCCSSATETSRGSAPDKRAAPPEGASQVRYRIDKMDCPTEERLIRNRLEAMPGVVRLDFNLMARELTVYHRLGDPQPIAAALNGLDMAPSLLEAGAPAAVLPPALSARMKVLLAVKIGRAHV